jgi:hypothetical protein
VQGHKIVILAEVEAKPERRAGIQRKKARRNAPHMLCWIPGQRSAYRPHLPGMTDEKYH